MHSKSKLNHNLYLQIFLFNMVIRNQYRIDLHLYKFISFILENWSCIFIGRRWSIFHKYVVILLHFVSLLFKNMSPINSVFCVRRQSKENLIYLTKFFSSHQRTFTRPSLRATARNEGIPESARPLAVQRQLDPNYGGPGTWAREADGGLMPNRPSQSLSSRQNQSMSPPHMEGK